MHQKYMKCHTYQMFRVFELQTHPECEGTYVFFY
jgi:hypothetical protein